MTEIPDDHQVVRQGVQPGVPVPPDGPARPVPLAVDVREPGAPDAGMSPEADAMQARRGCTGAQLRRFIKSRPYVPLHELRRRFELAGEADELSPLETEDGVAFIGLPERECGLLQDLLRQGDIGVELCIDPDVAVVVGVFPMRPVPRT